MREVVLEEQARGTIELRSCVNSYELDKLNEMERIRNGRGFTRDGNMRALTNISVDYIHSLVNQGDKDAVAFMASGFRDLKALSRLAYRFPQFRSSEGAI